MQVYEVRMFSFWIQTVLQTITGPRKSREGIRVPIAWEATPLVLFHIFPNFIAWRYYLKNSNGHLIISGVLHSRALWSAITILKILKLLLNGLEAIYFAAATKTIGTNA